MTNALVHKTGAAIQWARDYGQAHPKQRGIFWVAISIIFLIIPAVFFDYTMNHLGKNVAELVVMLAIIPVMFAIQKEEARKILPKNIPILILCGALPAVILVLSQNEMIIHGSMNDIPFHYYTAFMLNTAFIVPLYEEKLCRGLLLRGLESLLSRKVIAIVLTSMLFGVAHKGNELVTFFHGLIMGYLACYQRIGAVERAVIHGSYNFAIFMYFVFHVIR